ncbi:MAG: exonuclease domain-containing protein [Bacteroidetes bacterium]|nr:exonuclease domain-containing protein [Bacteroidota bacterium]
MNSFTAIDFDIANGFDYGICQVGLVRVENGIITNEINILVQPPDNYYWESFMNLYGITPQDTAIAPTFDKIWYLLEPFIKNQLVVAHNGLWFEFPLLKKTLEYYKMPVPRYKKIDINKIFKTNLASLCRHYYIYLQRQNALSDAKACAELYLLHLNQNQ